MRTPRVLVIGNTGQVGWELQRSLSTFGELIPTGRSAPVSVDLLDNDSIRAVIRDTRPSWIVNAAAYTAVDKAESDAISANQINGIAPGIIAEEANRIGAALIHYSTDYVFDGKATTPYTENATPAPLNVYGSSKLLGENAVQSASDKYLILRTSWVYGLRGNNFLRTMLRLGAERDELGIVADQHGSPTWSRIIAEATAAILAKNPQADSVRDLHGIYNLTCAGQTTWHGFANEIFSLFDPERLRIRNLKPIATRDYPTPAKRPAYSVLSLEKTQNCFGVFMPQWDVALRLAMADLR